MKTYLKCTLISVVTWICIFSFPTSFCHDLENNLAVNNFRDYLRINTAMPNPDYEPAITWIQQQAVILGLDYNFQSLSKLKEEFVIWLTWPGVNPDLDSVMLFSHIDVVAVDDNWTHDPFGAEMDSDGNIYGRGAQDMKSAAVQYLEAIRNMKAKGIRPNRTIHVVFCPDEEAGGAKGIRLWILTPQFMNLNIGLFVDEGLPNDNEEFSVFYAQRIINWVKFTAHGNSGHGSLLLENTAAEKIRKVVNKLLDLREVEKSRLEADSSLKLGDVTTINLNMLEGGQQVNMIPPKLSASFDIRFTPKWTYAEVQKLLDDTCAEAGPNVTYEVFHSTLLQERENPVTKLDNSNWWWRNFQAAFDSMNLTLVPRIFPAGTDGEVVRRLGIPTLGFSPIFNTSMRFHDRNEYLNAHVFLRGIEIYESLIGSLAYVPPPPPPPTTTSTTSDPLISSTHAHGLASNSSTTTKKPSKAKSSAPAPSRCSVLIWIMSCVSCYYKFVGL